MLLSGTKAAAGAMVVTMVDEMILCEEDVV